MKISPIKLINCIQPMKGTMTIIKKLLSDLPNFVFNINCSTVGKQAGYGIQKMSS
jgi:hypothetical protein